MTSYLALQNGRQKKPVKIMTTAKFENAYRGLNERSLSMTPQVQVFSHGGVVKSLVEHDLLPDLISDASAGSIIAALVGTRTNEELKDVLTPEVIYTKFREWRLWTGFSKGSLLDSTNLENALI